MDKNKIWILASAIVMVGILALGWFVGVDPQLKARASTEEQRISVEAQNTATELAIAKLKADFEGIDELQTELAGLRTSIPADGSLPTFLSQLDTLASESGTKVTSLEVAEAIEYTPPATSVVVPPVEDEEGATADSGAADTDPAVTAPEVPETPTVTTDPRITAENFVVIPITVAVLGDRDGARSFVDKLQHGPRLFMATQITISPDEENPMLEVATVTGYIYTLLSK
jgi:Tfp pilus assembly protein PilO